MKFESPLEIHGSQTTRRRTACAAGLSPLWKYMALKPPYEWERLNSGLSPLWKYTALKRRGGGQPVRQV